MDMREYTQDTYLYAQICTYTKGYERYAQILMHIHNIDDIHINISWISWIYVNIVFKSREYKKKIPLGAYYLNI